MNKYERFFDKVQKTGDRRSDCWNWVGATNGRGYGDFWDGERNIVAHRFLMPPIPEGKEACHHCDNRLCVRPSHLFIGTRSDNMRDCVAKGRLRPMNGNAAATLRRRKLSDDQVLEIRRISDHTSKTGDQRRLALLYGVSEAVISDVVTNKTYRHVARI